MGQRSSAQAAPPAPPTASRREAAESRARDAVKHHKSRVERDAAAGGAVRALRTPELNITTLMKRERSDRCISPVMLPEGRAVRRGIGRRQ